MGNDLPWFHQHLFGHIFDFTDIFASVGVVALEVRRQQYLLLLLQ